MGTVFIQSVKVSLVQVKKLCKDTFKTNKVKIVDKMDSIPVEFRQNRSFFLKKGVFSVIFLRKSDDAVLNNKGQSQLCVTVGEYGDFANLYINL